MPVVGFWTIVKGHKLTYMNRLHALPKGYLLKGYRIEKVIGGGGFSIVYLANKLDTREWVAIKEYLPAALAVRIETGRVEPASEQTGTPYRQGIKRFFDEGAAISKVNHPNIVRVTNFFRANNTVYMVMVYEQGKDLRWYIKRHEGRLSEKFIRTVFPQILNGLHELHCNQLLHLDIKPANIFLRPGGNPLLLDFGAAQGPSLGNENGPNTLTPGFAPMEQHKKETMGPWTDLYATGASILACMTGRAPQSAIERMIKDKYKPVARSLKGRYSTRLLEAVDWCLAMKPADRPQSVPALLEAIGPHPAEETTNGNSLVDYFTRPIRMPWSKG